MGVIEKIPWMEIVFVLYMFIATFTLISLLTGLMADQMNRARDETAELEEIDKDKKMREVLDTIKLHLVSPDEEYITLDRFQNVLHDEKHRKALREIENVSIDLEPEEAEDLF